MEDRAKILIVDDERLNLNVLSDLLRQDYKVVLAKNGNQALDRINSDNQPDLVLLDVIMPELDGYEVLRKIKSSDETKGIPVIFITALDSEHDEARGLEMGAVDYIRKPFHPPIVKARVKNHLTIARQRKLLEGLANLDGLTEMPNRRSFELALEREWRRCSRSGDKMSLAMLDVDCFKQYNDNYGHTAGDEVLKKVADLLQAEVQRPADVAARYGGEEFVLLLPETDSGGGRYIAEKIRVLISELGIKHEHSSVSNVLTVSLGGVTVVPSSFSKAQDLTVGADSMLYEAKRRGRNMVLWTDLT
ncbi:diguanylate cyclase [Desulfovibrio sp. JC022]|uniref:GGDEF domain-containing response regulator n=1 Tax=Desulfovibrio sp. JC022 TaxID=2593642 RepID=UPI0013D5E765|nr:diguanylate cyclase [Desulfovibrio sp. JC022]NDV23085.1 diguanylate cyclase [Desulfovibrio sp. JC022]